MQSLKPNKQDASTSQPDKGQFTLSRREQFNVVLMGLLLFLVLGALWAVVFVLGKFSPLAEVSECISEGEYRRALQIGLMGLAYTFGLPTGMCIGLVIFIQGLAKRRTGLTEWVLLELDEQKVKERYLPPTPEASLTSKNVCQQPANPKGKYWLPIAAILCGLCLFGGGIYLGGLVDPAWQVALLTAGAALAVLGIRTASFLWPKVHGDFWIPTWLGLLILMFLMAAPMWYGFLIALAAWIRGQF